MFLAVKNTLSHFDTCAARAPTFAIVPKADINGLNQVHLGERSNLGFVTSDDFVCYPDWRRQSGKLRSGRRRFANFLEVANNHIAAVGRTTMVGGVALEFGFVNPAEVIQA